MLENTSFKNPVTPEPTVWLLAQAMPHASMLRAGSGYSKCNFVKLQTICNLNICKRYILTEGFQHLFSVRGCITAGPLPLFQPNHAGLWCCYKEQHFECTGFVQIFFRLQSNHSQFALRIKARKDSRSISFRSNTRFCFGSTFSEGKEDIERDFSQHLLTPSIQPITYSPGFSTNSE